MTNSERIQANNEALEEAIALANSLPDAGAVIEPLNVTKNGTYTAPNGVDGYSPVSVNVPVPDGYIKPSGTLNITKNGSHDVTQYATASVNVPVGVTVQRVAGSYTTDAAGEAYVVLDFKPDLVVLSNNASFEKAAAYSALEMTDTQLMSRSLADIGGTLDIWCLCFDENGYKGFYTVVNLLHWSWETSKYANKQMYYVAVKYT